MGRLRWRDDYAIDWGAEYLADSDILTESSWSVMPDEPDGVVVAGSDLADRQSTVQVSGGIPGRVYRVVNRVITQSGRTDQRSLVLRVEMLLGWRPGEFWDATPAELAMALSLTGQPMDAPDLAKIEELKRRFPD